MQSAAVLSEAVPADAEAELIEAAKHDRARFADLYELHVDGVYAYLLSRTVSEQDAADLTQQVFLQAMRALPRFRSREVPFGGWLYRIARNAAINHSKRRRRTVELTRLPGLELAANPDYAGWMERRERVRELLARLDDASKELLILRFGADLSCGEIATALGKREPAVRMQITRILRSLKEDESDDDI